MKKKKITKWKFSINWRAELIKQFGEKIRTEKFVQIIEVDDG